MRPSKTEDVRVAMASFTCWSDRVCWAKVTLIAEKAGCSERTAQRAIRTLEREGVIECLGHRLPSGRWVKSLVYRFAKGVRRVKKGFVTQRTSYRKASTPGVLGSVVRNRCASRNSWGGRAKSTWKEQGVELVPFEPSEPERITTREVLGDFIDVAASRGVKLPTRTKGMYARAVKELLDEGFEPSLVTQALHLQLDSGKLLPTALHSFLVDVQLRGKTRHRRFGYGVSSAEIGDMIESGELASQVRALNEWMGIEGADDAA